MFQSDNLSPYRFAKLVNGALKGIQPKDLPPQMIYTYVSKGYIKAQTNDLGKLYITPEVGNAWIAARGNKLQEKLSQVAE